MGAFLGVLVVGGVTALLMWNEKKDRELLQWNEEEFEMILEESDRRCVSFELVMKEWRRRVQG